MSAAARATEERAAALEAAARLLALAMRESHPPVEVLAGALERMAAALAQCAHLLERERTPEGARSDHLRASPLRELAATQQALERDIALCIESLQFHDRMMQRLERVVRSIARSAAPAHGSEGRPGASLAAGSAAAEILCGPASPEGSIELFE